ncbi:MAG: histidine phosphatase family protein [Lachnospiraceae bacterium]|nr:histidine phosphatase family protein [Lachnospiraceae bacterium]
MEIYIVRHGETIWNADKRLQGSCDIELNEYGRELAGETGRNLEDVHFDMIYSSPLLRAYETANLIRGHRNIKIKMDERLRELNFGINEGEDFSKLLADESDPFHYFFKEPDKYVAPEYGETLEHLCERAKEFMQEVIEPLAALDHTRVMIVGHGALNKAIMCYVKQHGVDKFWSGGLQKNCNVIIVNLDEKGYTVIDETRLFYDER